MANKKQDTGAAAALAAIEHHELECRTEKDKAHAEWKEKLEKLVVGDEVSERDERLSHSRYIESVELWDESTKKLAVFDKGVSPERREGEKILVSDCKEYFAQYDLSLSLALEAYITTIAQAAALCSSPEEFHKAHAETIRATHTSAIEKARQEGVIPAWL